MSDARSIAERLESHQLWQDTRGEQGEELVLEEEDLRGHVFDDLSLCEAWLTDTNFAGASFVNTDMFRINCYDCDLSNANLTGVLMAKGTVEGCVARNSLFSNARLLRTDFHHSDLRGSSFRGADLRQTSFWFADMRGCTFSGALLKGTGFKDTRCDWTVFDGLEGAIHADRILWGSSEEPMSREECAAYLASRSKVTVIIPESS